MLPYHRDLLVGTPSLCLRHAGLVRPLDANVGVLAPVGGVGMPDYSPLASGISHPVADLELYREDASDPGRRGRRHTGERGLDGRALAFAFFSGLALAICVSLPHSVG